MLKLQVFLLSHDKERIGVSCFENFWACHVQSTLFAWNCYIALSLVSAKDKRFHFNKRQFIFRPTILSAPWCWWICRISPFFPLAFPCPKYFPESGTIELDIDGTFRRISFAFQQWRHRSFVQTSTVLHPEAAFLHLLAIPTARFWCVLKFNGKKPARSWLESESEREWDFRKATHRTQQRKKDALLTSMEAETHRKTAAEKRK